MRNIAGKDKVSGLQAYMKPAIVCVQFQMEHLMQVGSEMNPFPGNPGGARIRYGKYRDVEFDGTEEHENKIWDE